MATALQPAQSEREMQEIKVSSMLALLPESVDAERFKAFSVAILRDPKLKSCSEQSKLLALADCAKLGLYPDRNLGHVWLVPYGNAVTLIPGYQGYIELARRSGAVKSVHADVVRQGDTFRVWTDDHGRHLLHEPDVFGDRGEPVGVYCIATTSSGPPQIEVMSWDDVMKVRERSKAGNSGPWKTDTEAMARKTVVRRARKYWPQSPELAALGAMDDKLDGLVIDGVGMEPSKRVSRSKLTLEPIDSQDDATPEPEQQHTQAPEKPARKRERAPDGSEIPELFDATPDAVEGGH